MLRPFPAPPFFASRACFAFVVVGCSCPWPLLLLRSHQDGIYLLLGSWGMHLWSAGKHFFLCYCFANGLTMVINTYESASVSSLRCFLVLLKLVTWPAPCTLYFLRTSAIAWFLNPNLGCRAARKEPRPFFAPVDASLWMFTSHLKKPGSYQLQHENCCCWTQTQEELCWVRPVVPSVWRSLSRGGQSVALEDLLMSPSPGIQSFADGPFLHKSV